MTYLRRFRMELDLQAVTLPQPKLPPRYFWTDWTRSSLDRHASVKYRSFREEIDSRIFPCLGEAWGCLRLMQDISQQSSFLPIATWLVSFRPSRGAPARDCGTIQGLAHSPVMGAVQNVGVVPEHRGNGLGRALVLKALHGFRSAGLRRVYLEVTAENRAAVELYRSIGFRLSRTMYKPMPDEAASAL